jgi:hypothetical protein
MNGLTVVSNSPAGPFNRGRLARQGQRRLQRRRPRRHPLAERRWHARDLADERQQRAIHGGAGSFNPGPDWQVKATGDFNGDGKSDILWQGSDGTPAIWLMNGLTVLSNSPAGSFNPGPTWHIMATGDFNGDSKSDILWQNDDGTPAIWLMNGSTVLSNSAAGSFNPGPTWHIKATGDFNGDASPTSCGRTTTAHRDLATMNGSTVLANTAVGPFNPRGQTGRLATPATSTATASPTSCGRATTAHPSSG